MFFINFKILRILINWGDNLKVKNAQQKNLATFWQLFFLWIYVFHLLISVKNNLIPTSSGFNVIALQIYWEILKKYRKRAITLQKNNFSKNWENRCFFFYISTSDGGDFPRIIDIALSIAANIFFLDIT